MCLMYNVYSAVDIRWMVSICNGDTPINNDHTIITFSEFNTTIYVCITIISVSNEPTYVYSIWLPVVL